MESSYTEQAEHALLRLQEAVKQSHQRLDEQESRFGDAYSRTLTKVAKLEILLIDLQSATEMLRNQMQIFELRLNQLDEAIADVSRDA